jgi:hypothetical protein
MSCSAKRHARVRRWSFPLRALTGERSFRRSSGHQLDIRWKDHPLQSRPRPNMHSRLDPIWIVQCSNCNRTLAGSPFAGPCYGGSASWTKLGFYPATALIRVILISVKYAASKFHGAVIEVCTGEKSAPSYSFATSTMANRFKKWRRFDSVTNRPAQTATFMHFRHFYVTSLFNFPIPTLSINRTGFLGKVWLILFCMIFKLLDSSRVSLFYG